MSASAAPFGMRPLRHPSGRAKSRQYKDGIQTGYASNIFRGSSVILNTSGFLNIGTAAADILGVFDGCEYTDANGRRIYSPYWPASTTATEIIAWVYDDPLIEYEIQANGSVAFAAIGDQGDLVNPGNGSTVTGLSSSTLNSTLGGAGVQKQLRILGVSPYPDNDFGDAFTIVRVQIARHQYVAVKVAI